MPSERSLVMASVGREAEPAGDHEVGAGRDDLLGVDRGEGGDVGEGRRPRPGSRCRHRSRRPGRRHRGRTGSRSWPASARRSSAAPPAIVTAVPSSSVSDAGIGGGRRRARGGGRRSRPAWRWRGPRSGMSMAQRCRSTRQGSGRGPRRGPAAGRAARPAWTGERREHGNLRSGMDSEGSRRIANPSLRHASKEGPNRSVARVLPTFLSKVRACTVWSATGLALSGERSP